MKIRAVGSMRTDRHDEANSRFYLKQPLFSLDFNDN